MKIRFSLNKPLYNGVNLRLVAFKKAIALRTKFFIASRQNRMVYDNAFLNELNGRTESLEKFPESGLTWNQVKQRARAKLH